MLTYNFDRVFKARAIEKPFTFLRKCGFSDNFATKIKNNRVKRLNLNEIERLCLVLKCTPNDFFEWQPDNSDQIEDAHPLNTIKRSGEEVDLIRTLNTLPLGKIPAIYQLIKNALNNEDTL